MALESVIQPFTVFFDESFSFDFFRDLLEVLVFHSSGLK